MFLKQDNKFRKYFWKIIYQNGKKFSEYKKDGTINDSIKNMIQKFWDADFK